MASRFAVPTKSTLARYRAERDALMGQARRNFGSFGDPKVTLEMVRQARDRQRKVLWARRSLGWDATAP